MSPSVQVRRQVVRERFEAKSEELTDRMTPPAPTLNPKP